MMKWLNRLKQIFCLHNLEEMCYRGMTYPSFCYKRELMNTCTDPITKQPCENCYLRCSRCGKIIEDHECKA